MKWAIALALVGFVIVASWMLFFHDLRGWEQMYPEDPQRIAATLPGKPDFTLADCVPWGIDPYAPPTSEEYSGSATATVLTCRSTSSALMILLSYLAIVACLLFVLRTAINRK